MSDLLPRSRFRGLRARLLAVVLLAVLPLAVLLFVYASVQNGDARERARLEVQRGVESDVRSVQDLISQSRATLVTFGITFAVQAKRWDLVQGNAERLVVEHPDYALIAVADETGRVMAQSSGATGQVDVSREPFFKSAVASRGLTVSDYRVDPVLGRRAIAVSLPVYDAKDRLVAVEWIALEAEQLRKRLTPGGVAPVEMLIDGEGTLVARIPASAALEGKTARELTLVRTVLTEKQGVATVPGFDGKTREYHFAPVLPADQGALYVIAGYVPGELFARQRTVFALTLAGFGAFALVALVFAGLTGTYSIYRPARELEQAAVAVSGGDLSARAGIPDDAGEFGRLSREFNAMAEAIERQVGELEQARTELRTLNRGLEERVRRRTAELEASNKELEAFSYSVSHDLRSPLRAIDGFSQALLEDHSDQLDEEGRDDLRRVREAASRMGRLIDSLLQLSRLSRQPMSVEDVDLSSIAAEVAVTLGELEPGRDVSFEIAPGVKGTGDAVLLRNVLENLLGNAWKFTCKHPSACIEFGSLIADDEQVYFVRDDGAGFDMAYADKLFGAFQRVHGQTEFPGIGIGLATTARIIHRHGGRIWAEAEPDRGATFYFTLS